MLTYTVILNPEPDGSAVNVTVPALPGVLTWGATTEEALDSAREAIELHLESYVERGLPFPPGRLSSGKQVLTVCVSAPAAAHPVD
jgi:predicted RNase H-like HicB family nuclease